MKHLHPDTIPSLLYANAAGEITDFPDLKMAGRSGSRFSLPEKADLIPLPEGSELFVLPGRDPVGIDPADGDAARLDINPVNPDEGIQAVAAFMAPAHTAIFSASYEKQHAEIPPLPLFAYTAVGWHENRFWVAAFRSDPDMRQDADRFQPDRIKTKTITKLKKFPDNRLIQHLGKCSLTYSCPAAKNYFLGRWEAPLPTSPTCNADCLGCISLQKSGCCPSTQDRIQFVPTADEIVQIAVPHLNKAKRPVVSFGQGCEGEPLLQAKTIEKAVRKIRLETAKGTINLNTNASLPDAVERLAHAGLDSIRVSINSARKEFHSRYYRPKGFDFADVLASIKAMKQNKKFVSLNYFILPGFTDDPDEFTALCKLLEHYEPDLIQLRNLNMDPDWYLTDLLHAPKQDPMGMRNWLDELKRRFPSLKFGYFNPALR